MGDFFAEKSYAAMTTDVGGNEVHGRLDFIVCDAGPSGSVVAARLAETPHVRVLLVEAGGGDDVPDVMDPVQWPLNLGSERDWVFVAQPNSHLNGRAIPLNMGQVLGGGSSINVCVWARGHQNDGENDAAETGDKDWGYESVLDIYRRIEDWQGAPDPLRRGVGRPVQVQSAGNPQPIARAMVDAARSLGVPAFDSPNGKMMEGRGGGAINAVIIKNGRRSSIFRSYVYPLMGRPNLTVLTRTLVSKLIIQGKSVVGVEGIEASATRRYWAEHEVILSLGAIHTPKVLMQSGIGPADELQRYDSPVVQHLPGVGQNHQDPAPFGCIFGYRTPQPIGHGGSEATLYWKNEAGLARPDIFHCQVEFPMPSPETAALGGPEHGWTMFAGLAHPKNRGLLLLSVPDMDDPIRIEANTLSHPDDLRMAFVNIALYRELGNSSIFHRLVKGESLPGNLNPRAMKAYVRNSAVTYWHQCRTAKMGRDALSVVNSRLKVYGIDRLRLADVSILPNVPSGNTTAPCVVIGARAADMIKVDHRL